MLPTPQKKSDFGFPENQAVMEQVKKQRAPSESMDVVEILEKSAGTRGADAVQVNNELAHMVNSSPNVRVIRANRNNN